MKNCLAALGLIFLALLAIIGVLLTLAFFDLTLPPGSPVVTLNGTPVGPPVDSAPVSAPDFYALATQVGGGVKIERSIPPTPGPLLTLPPASTPTPLPPLDPVVYRTEVMLRAKSFSTALQAFMDANEELRQNNGLLNDPAWQSKMRTILDQVASNGQSLAEVGPPPAEYAAIDAWLKRTGEAAQGLKDSYARGLETNDPQDFTAAGEQFTRIREDLFNAVQEMANAGWPME